MFISDCNGGDNQDWALNAYALTTYNGSMCLDVPNGDHSNGVPLQLWKCWPNNPNQQWFNWLNNRDYLSWVGHNRCLDLTDGDVTNGNRVQIWHCKECVETLNVCLITDSRNPGTTTIKARFRSLLLCYKKLTLGALLVWWSSYNQSTTKVP